MSKNLTLILIAPSHLARVDVSVGRKAKVRNTWTRERVPSEPLAGQVDVALRLGPKKAGDVWVLPCEAWTGVVSLERELAGMLEGDELQQSIALETEAFSGISAFDSRLGATKLPPDVSGDPRWWVTQITHSDWQETHRCVNQFGAKWGGMAHPAAAFPVDTDTASTDDSSWKMIQAFGETTVAMAGAGQRIVDVMVAGNLATQRTTGQLEQWRSIHAATGNSPTTDSVVWVSDASVPPRLVDEADTVKPWFAGAADEQVVLAAWGKAFAEGLTPAKGDEAHVPAMAADKPPMSNRSATLTSCVMAVASVLACFGLHTLTTRNIDVAVEEAGKLDQQRQKLGEDKKSLAELQKKVTALRTQVDGLRTRNRSLDRDLASATQMRRFQQTRWVQMVSSLAQCTSGDCWVRAIRSDNGSVHVEGVAVENQDVAAFASQLESAAAAHGWRAHPAQTEHNELGLIQFEITMDMTDETTADSSSSSELVSLQTEI